MTGPGDEGAAAVCRRWREEAGRLDVAVYAAIAETPTPAMDAAIRRLSRAADRSKLWIATSGLFIAFGGERGRRAATTGVASIALTSAVVNQVLKRLGNRRRPDRGALGVPVTRQVDMPRSTSWPSGHAASAFAFSTGFGSVWPEAGAPISILATLVAYSRVHTGVHYPSDAIAGALSGMALAQLTVAGLERRRRPPSPRRPSSRGRRRAPRTRPR